ncbi:tail fiber protein [Flammeovirga agarivorans]|uniref:Tail fiber protein n=1 Tax=Flammeovirga agarivorans TaxID=2726742 RepID=A0A7X8SQQ2_9BACT|nr:tail fiber protein [Flammeovirga agarivorans]NLR94615.1 tail fiber protein [Flammeovirga agarivorans]
MKLLYISFFSFLLSLSVNAQTGIVIQGIARTSAHTAIQNETMTFTFAIKNTLNHTKFTETQVIQTDDYGVFSHVIGTGTGGDLNNVDFSEDEMSLRISVEYNGNTIVISEEPFQYVPYAKSAEKAVAAVTAETSIYADNGCPVGTIMPFLGTWRDVPDGWLLCNGQSIPQSSDLIGVLQDTNVPDLRGLFLRGIGTNGEYTTTGGSAPVGPSLNQVQKDQIQSHNHYLDISTSTDGAHVHEIDADNASDVLDSEDGDRVLNNKGNESEDYDENTLSAGDHTHTFSGNTHNTGDNETRPIAYGVNYIIKY